MDALLRDCRLALRRLGRSPGFALFAVASLALAIGVSTAVYSSVRAFFWAPRGLPQASQLVTIGQGSARSAPVSWLDFDDLRSQQSVFAGLCATTSFGTAIAVGGQASVAIGEAVSADYFATLQLAPAAGRLLQRADDASDARVAVVSERFWRTRLQQNPAAIGQPIKVGGRLFTLVGVVRGEFHGLEQVLQTAVWIPAAAAAAGGVGELPSGLLQDRGASVFKVWGRLEPAIAVGAAQSQVATVAHRLDADYPRPAGRERKWQLRQDAQALLGEATADSLGELIVLTALMVLLIASSNIANLGLARASARSQDVAIRMAMGASRWHLIREQVFESAAIAVFAGAGGLWMARTLLDLTATDLSFAPGLTIAFHPDLDRAGLAMGLLATTLAALMAGLWPAIQTVRQDVRASLGPGRHATPVKWRLHRTFVAWQVAGSAALLLVAVMCVQIVHAVAVDRSDAPYDALALAEIEFDVNGRPPAEMTRLVDEITTAARRGRDVEALAVSDGLPFGWYTFGSSVAIRGDGGAGLTTYMSILGISPAFPAVTGLRLLRGHWFSEQDTVSAPAVAVIGERLAKSLFQAADPVGRHVLFRESPAAAESDVTVVGVAADPDVSQPGRLGALQLFVPYVQRAAVTRRTTFTARSRHPGRAVAALREAIAGVDRDLAISRSGTGTTLLDGPMVFFRIIQWACAVLGAFALVLAAAGLFGVVSHVMQRRTREMGIRLAIGATRQHIFRLVLRDGSGPVLEGLLIGFLIGIGGRIAIWSRIVTHTSPFGPQLLLLVPIPFFIAALTACYLPARRASRVDPNVALRDL